MVSGHQAEVQAVDRLVDAERDITANENLREEWAAECASAPERRQGNDSGS